MASVSLIAPASVGTRDLVRKWLEQELDKSLEGDHLSIDCVDLRSATPSFVDEILKVVLVERHAARLSFVNAPERAELHVERSAANRSVVDRVEVIPPPKPTSAQRVRRWLSPSAAR